MKKARPFIKFPGGKRGIIEELRSRVPEKFETYHEPFVGGGALFFELQPERARLSDINPELMLAYNVVRRNVDDLIKALSKLRYYPDDLEKSARYFYRLRKLDRHEEEFKKLSDSQVVARMIYMNKTAFNGLYRVNRKGQFNAPFGKYKNPTFLDAENLRACSATLQSARLACISYRKALKRVRAGDFVYLDPPYIPVSETANFVSYSADGFDLEDQQMLAKWCRALDKRGAFFMLSNSNTPEAKELYKGFRIETIAAPRAINRNADGRKGSDIIVRNF